MSEKALISRADARDAGLKRYFTGKSCCRGHLSERLVSCGACVDCHYPRLLAKRLANPQKHSAYVQAWRDRNQVKAKEIKQRSDRKYVQTHRAAIRAYMRNYDKRHPGQSAARCRARQTAKLSRTPPWANLDDIRLIYDAAAHLSKHCGIKMHVDHVIPLRGEHVSGLHVAENLQILPASQNIAKSNKLGLHV
jgi:hypothetical protein